MKKILGLISLLSIFILLLALSACANETAEPEPEPFLELRVYGNPANIAGEAISMIQGSQLQFRATLVQDGVTVSEAQFGWNIVANTRDSTQRNATSPLATPIVGTDVVGGLVRIAPNQPGGLLRLNVTTVHEGRVVSTHAIINVINPLPLIIPDTAHETFQDPETGTVWRVLLPDDGYGNALIITEYVHILNTRYHSSVGFTLFQSAEASTNLRQWWNNNWTGNGITTSPLEQNAIGPTLRARALDYVFQDESGAPIPRTSTATGAGIEVNRGNGSANSQAGAVPNNTNVLHGRTRPIPNSNATAEPFILSTSEANHYFSGSFGPQGRQTQQFNSTSTGASWWLRSPGNFYDDAHNDNLRHAFVQNDNGSINTGSDATNTDVAGLRPALWIRR